MLGGGFRSLWHYMAARRLFAMTQCQQRKAAHGPASFWPGHHLVAVASGAPGTSGAGSSEEYGGGYAYDEDRPRELGVPIWGVQDQQAQLYDVFLEYAERRPGRPPTHVMPLQDVLELLEDFQLLGSSPGLSRQRAVAVFKGSHDCQKDIERSAGEWAVTKAGLNFLGFQLFLHQVAKTLGCSLYRDIGQSATNAAFTG